MDEKSRPGAYRTRRRGLERLIAEHGVDAELRPIPAGDRPHRRSLFLVAHPKADEVARQDRDGNR
jgi:hypothetical protein